MNIYDIAKLAGVSIATVSRVVNGSAKVSARTREKVLRIMEEQNYTPNVFARGLGLGSMQAVGIICPDVADPFMAQAVACLEKSLRGYGYDCILSCSGYAPGDKRRAVERIMDRGIDALLLVGSNYSEVPQEDSDYIRSAASSLPVFLINGLVEGENIFNILADDRGAVYRATEALLLSGRKRILFLANSRSHSASQKLKGYEDALRSRGMPVLGELKFYTESPLHEVRDLLLLNSSLCFDSVIAAEDSLGVAALKYARARGLKVPQELSVIGYNNSILSVSCEPELTSVDNRKETLCRMAVDSLMAHINGAKVPPVQYVETNLVKRCTTDF